MKQFTILLVDDHELFREGIASLLNAQPELKVTAQAGDGLEALTLARDLRPDLIVMDISMPVCDGLEATRLIHERFPELKILILTVHEEEQKLFAAIRAGAGGYLLKSTDSEGFLIGVRGALKGEAYLPPKLAANLLEEFARLEGNAAGSISLDADFPDLTSREQDVLSLIARRASDKEIATHLSISVHTVKTHVRNILSKLHLSNRRQAARLAAQKGVVSSPKFPEKK